VAEVGLLTVFGLGVGGWGYGIDDRLAYGIGAMSLQVVIRLE
jgi:hypothetical protein